MSDVENLSKESEALFQTTAKMLTAESSQLRFGMLPAWAELKRKEGEPEINRLLEKLYDLWMKLEGPGRVYAGNKGYREWVEARISVIKATARLDGHTGYMIKSAIRDGSLPQRWRSLWAYMNIR